MKTIYDCGSCVLALVMAFCFFGGFVGVKWGTFVCALFNGRLIGLNGRISEKVFVFKDGLSLRNIIH